MTVQGTLSFATLVTGVTFFGCVLGAFVTTQVLPAGEAGVWVRLGDMLLGGIVGGATSLPFAIVIALHVRPVTRYVAGAAAILGAAILVALARVLS